ncbi:MAG: hypothetical protein B7Y77_01435 [Bradyrhizobium sp. 35-63-5]|nr:MAG: hypothetical protein B7Y77_01435 [Bradyrhizobium sp. 35-63-5]
MTLSGKTSSGTSSENKPSSFKIAAGLLGVAVVAKASIFAIALGILAATPADAGSLGKACTAAPQSQWLSIDALQAKVEAQGYKVRNAKLKKACGEIYATDKDGKRVELFVDPTNGAIVGQL